MPSARFENKTLNKQRLPVRSVGRRARPGSCGCGGRLGPRLGLVPAGAVGGCGAGGGKAGAPGAERSPSAVSPAPRILRGRRSRCRPYLARRPPPRSPRAGPGLRQPLPGRGSGRGDCGGRLPPLAPAGADLSGARPTPPPTPPPPSARPEGLCPRRRQSPSVSASPLRPAREVPHALAPGPLVKTYFFPQRFA